MQRTYEEVSWIIITSNKEVNFYGGSEALLYSEDGLV